MRPDRRNMPEQEQSIKEREQELFVEPRESPAPKPSAKPFAVYLRETPADPISSPARAILWTIGVIVLILLALAIWRSQRPSRPRPKPRPAEPEATALAGPPHAPCPDRSGTVPDLPGCVANGDSREELVPIREAIELHLEGMAEDGIPIREPSSRVEYVEVDA